MKMSSIIIKLSLRNFVKASPLLRESGVIFPSPKVGVRGGFRIAFGAVFRSGLPFFHNFAHIRQNPLYYKGAPLKKFVEIFATERIFLGNFHYG